MSARIVGVTWKCDFRDPKGPIIYQAASAGLKNIFQHLVRPASSLSGRGRGEKYSQPVPPYFNELLGILQVGGVFWNLILIGGQRFKINLFICFVHPQKTSKQPIIGNSQSRRKGAPWKIWARPKQSRLEDFKQLITNCRKYMKGVAHRRNGSEFKLNMRFSFNGTLCFATWTSEVGWSRGECTYALRKIHKLWIFNCVPWLTSVYMLWFTSFVQCKYYGFLKKMING